VTAALAETKQPRLEQPTLYLRMHVAQYQLTAGDVDACKAAVAGAKDSLDALQDVRLRLALRLRCAVLSSRHSHPAECPSATRCWPGCQGVRERMCRDPPGAPGELRTGGDAAAAARRRRPPAGGGTTARAAVSI